MTSQSDGGIVSFSSMRQPPLIKRLKGILSEYPDGGQILKELIQNAEDAGASLVDIEYDSRRINDNPGETSHTYTKFFKGPALCVYNDAVFTEKDWDGIRMIDSSVKEDDPLKVGRFGLGFKSVFHITDYPCVISGDQLLMIDPQQQFEKVNAMVKLCDIHQLENSGLPTEVFWKSMRNKFGLTDECIKKGYFKGTIFRFPLREKISELSETLYIEEKVLGLYDDFKSDSSSILVFLKNLEKIRLNITTEGATDVVASVEILDEQNEVKKSRRKFRKRLEGVTREYQGDDIVHEAEMTIRTKTMESSNNIKWMVVNYYVGDSASPEFRRLILDENLGYSPLVGVARPLKQEGVDDFEGHVFCFLPLPKEGSKLTGLPVHVNGYFALSQSRHHLKQETDEQRGKKIDDKSILWNRCLMEEALPTAYCKLILSLIKRSTALDNTQDAVDRVYSCWPHHSNTLSRWQDLETELFKKLKTSKVFYANQMNEWIIVSEACFATFSCLSDKLEHVTSAVKNCMTKVGMKLVEVPSCIFDTARHHFKKVKDIRPDMLTKQLQRYSAYKEMSSSDKADILTYLLSDKNCYEKIQGLQLLPLESGSWTTFNKTHDPVYICNSPVVDLLIGFEDCIVLRMERLGKNLHETISKISVKGFHQVQTLSNKALVKLIESSLAKHFNEQPIYMTRTSKLSFDWLEALWAYLVRKKIISDCKDVPIVPRLIKGSWENPDKVQLMKVSDIILLKSYQKTKLSNGLVGCFEKMGVSVISALPIWIPVDTVKQLFFRPTPKGIVALLDFIYTKTNWRDTIDEFNNSCEKDDCEALVLYLSECVPLPENVKLLLMKLRVFKIVSCINDKGKYSLLNGTKRFILNNVNFPENISLPFECVVAHPTMEQLVKELGRHKLELHDLILAKLEDLESDSENEEIPTFMEYVMKHFHMFQMDDEIIQQASKIRFLRAGSQRFTPGELFDPSDSGMACLLYDECLFPETKKRLNKELIKILQVLGLRTIEDVNADILLQVAQSLDSWSRSCEPNKKYSEKAAAFMEFLKRSPSVLQDSCQGWQLLHESIEDLECVVADEHNQMYPDCLPRYKTDNLLCRPADVKEASLCLLVGASKSTVTCTVNAINSVFGWTDEPDIDTLFSQLETIKQNYSVRVRPDVMPSIKTLYDHLSQRVDEIEDTSSDYSGLIWTGDGFHDINAVTVLKQDGDLDLTPYIYSIPSEFENHSKLFEELGCRVRQDIEVLEDTLRHIQEVHSSRQETNVVRRDQRLVCSILDRIVYLARNVEMVEIGDILVMMHDSDKSVLKMCPLSQCVYDDDPDFFYEETGDMHLVHEMIPSETIEALGIPSITRKTLMDAEGLGVELWEQSESLTTRISTLLRDGYTDGLSIPKELVQNADDAGATTIKFLYDERQNNDARKNIFNREMASFQGPALWVYNDAQFSQQDLRNITKLNGASKQSDVQKIGKFGLGFCSVYNLTDLPSFVTGNSIVFFDPHEHHLGKILGSKNAGLKYTLPKRTLIERNCDQFRPYHGLFGCNILDEAFDGYSATLFRLPLRTEQQAKESKISSKYYSFDEMKSLIRMFIMNAGNLLLFSQNICSIKFYHLSEYSSNPKDAKLLYRLDKECLQLSGEVLLPVMNSVLSRVPRLLQNADEFTEVHKIKLCQQFPGKENDLFSDLDLSNCLSESETSWLISWAMGTGSSFNLYQELSSEGAVPLGAVSVPCSSGTNTPLKLATDVPTGFYTAGHIFCFLPLPIKTSLPVHINGCFSVTSDRRQLINMSEDDKGSKKYQWNESLLEDALVLAHINLLETIASSDVDELYQCYELWPSKSNNFIDSFTRSFYERILSDNVKVFRSRGIWYGFESVCYLESSLRKSSIGDTAYEFLYLFPPRSDEVLIDIPETVIVNIRLWNPDLVGIIDSKEIRREELLLTFLQNIQHEYWTDHSEERFLLLTAALDSNDDRVIEMMRNSDCIPTEPNQLLRKPSDLIHPNSVLSRMFRTDEEVFPSKREELRSNKSLQKLVALGMKEKIIPAQVLVERCKTVQTISDDCCNCAVDRINAILKYLSQYDVRQSIDAQKDVVQSLRDIYMLPVLSKPKNWKFSWKADINNKEGCHIACGNHCMIHTHVRMDSLLLTKPGIVWRQSASDLVGSICLVLKEDIIERSVSGALGLLAVNGPQDVSSDLIVEQLINLCDQYWEECQLSELQRLSDILLQRMSGSEESHLLKTLEKIPPNKKLVLIGNEILEPSKVALRVKQECRPFLYKLPEHEQRKRKQLFSLLGVKDYFDIETIISVMDELREGDVPDLPLINNLLIDLEEVLSITQTTYDDIKEYHQRIVAPDTLGRLWPTSDLVIENETFKTNIDLKILHPSIAPSLGQSLGVKVKQLRCFEEISIGISFGQREKLVTRIQGLLKAYPCDSSIMKELLQNADDAGATEIHFVKDYRIHTGDNLFSPNCRKMQGPSLCVYNNSYFTESDIEGIHDLGKGSKSDDPTRTGQYGVGFNAVYHLTDTPSFVTIGPDSSKDGLLFIFDPLCANVPKATLLEPGMMCPVSQVQDNFPGQLQGFSLDELIGNKPGTVFRFPLRSRQSEVSKHVVSERDMNEVIDGFKTDMLESMLFLKHIQRITISNITSGKLHEEYSVEIKMDEKDSLRRKDFSSAVKKKSKDLENKAELLSIEPIELIYPLKVYVDHKFFRGWLIVQRFGVKSTGQNLEEVRRSFSAGDLGLSPIGGVAVPLPEELIDFDANDFQAEVGEQSSHQRTRQCIGKAFCFLPLPILTGLPVHVNGHFALDHEARRDLWTEGFRWQWNQCVIENIIVPAWLSGLTFLSKPISLVVNKSKTWKDVNEEMDAFHALFPLLEKTPDKIWKHLATTFYRYTVQNEECIFPCVLKQNTDEESSELFDVSWESVSESESEGVFKGVFDSISNEMSSCRPFVLTKDCMNLVRLLKYLGLKLLHAPLTIEKSIQDSGLKSVKSSTPALVITFLHTYSDEIQRACLIGQINSPITNTKFENKENLKFLLRFLMLDPHFCEKVVGLPVILTCDEVVRECSLDYPVYISQFSDLLPGSEELFLDSSMLDILDPICEKLFKTKAFKELTFDGFVELLPKTLAEETFGRGTEIKLKAKEDEDVGECLKLSWLCRFYEFLLHDAKRAENGGRVSSEILLNNLKSIGDWSFLPCKKSSQETVLLPLNRMEYVLDLHFFMSASHENVQKILLKLEVPTLNTSVLRWNKNMDVNEITKSIQQNVASVDRPYCLMKFLLHYKDEVRTRVTSCREGKELLDYFGRAIGSLKRDCTSDLAHELRQLPFYSTLQGTLTDLDNSNEILVIPRGIPKDGIQEWATTCKVTLLQESCFHEDIQKFLGLKKGDVDYVYGEMILPKIHALPERHLYAHVKYLKDRIGCQYSLTAIQSKIVSHLSKIAFVRVNGVLRRADDLYDPQNELFQAMITGYHFPPPEYLTPDWLPFLRKLGLIHVLDDKLLLHFAREIERYCSNPSRDNVYDKSSILMRHFMDRIGSWSDQTLYELRLIRFIIPFKEHTKYTQVYPQLNNAAQLVCFRGSVSSKHSHLCWSSSNLIPDAIFNRLGKGGKMELSETPTVDSVILHCQNICPSLKNNIKDLSPDFVERQMTCFYEYFVKHASFDLSGIKDLDFVHLKEKHILIPAHNIVIDIPEYSEIHPYVYRAPLFYGKYHALFEVLGSKKRFMFCHYANILNNIANQSVDRPLNVQERRFVQKALLGMSYLKMDNDESAGNIRQLFLPNAGMVMKDSKQIVISDNFSMEQRLKGKVHIDLFAEKSFLELPRDFNFEHVIQKWPDHLKPGILSEVVTTQFCVDGSSSSTDYSIADIVKHFLRSQSLVTALCRLSKHQFSPSADNEKFDAESYERQISQRLCNINVVPMKSLKTVLKYKGSLVSGSEYDIPCHIEYGDGNVPQTFYIVDNLGQNWKLRISQGLHRLIRGCLLTKLSSECVISLINELDSPHNFSTILDNMYIKPYDSQSQREYFPAPGTYVERDFIPFLEQGIEPFEEYEYENVAMELDDFPDDDDDDNESLFIYVKIIREIKGSRRGPCLTGNFGIWYLVDSGNRNVGYESVPIYRLYRFVRRNMEPGALVNVGKVAGDEKPFDKHCQILKSELIQAWKLPESERKLIYRRLLLKWHPDKNLDNREYCTKIFNYLKIIYSRLVSGEIMVDSVEEEIFRGPSHPSQSTNDFHRDIERRAKKQSLAYKENYDQYVSSPSRGIFCHMRGAAAREKQPDIKEANRWLRQAKNDFRAAEAFFAYAEDVHAYNWICKMCHQACEIALKAVQYSVDRQSVNGSLVNRLRHLAPNPEISNQAGALDDRFVEPARLNYPDTTSRPRIPAEVFDKQDAEFAINTTKETLDMIDDFIG